MEILLSRHICSLSQLSVHGYDIQIIYSTEMRVASPAFGSFHVIHCFLASDAMVNVDTNPGWSGSEDHKRIRFIMLVMQAAVCF